MGLIINTNIESQAAIRYFENGNSRFNKAVRQASSGKRISSPGDDPTGLAISETLRKKVRSSRQAIRNTNIGISMVQVMDGAFETLTSFLIRLKELAIQSSTDTTSDEGRKAIEIETKTIVNDIDRVSKSTEFNGTKLLSKNSGVLDIQVGLNNTALDRKSIKFANLNCTTKSLGLESLTNVTKEGAHKSLGLIDGALFRMNSIRSHIGALQSALEKTLNKLSSAVVNIDSSKSRIRDADFLKVGTNLMKEKSLKKVFVHTLNKVNSNPALALKLLNKKKLPQIPS